MTVMNHHLALGRLAKILTTTRLTKPARTRFLINSQPMPPAPTTSRFAFSAFSRYLDQLAMAKLSSDSGGRYCTADIKNPENV